MTVPSIEPDDTDRGVSRVTAIDLAQTMSGVYADLETRLAADIARRLAAGMDAPDWARQKLAAVGQLRRWTRTLLERAGRETEQEITQALLLAYVRGGNEAMRTIARLQNTLPEWVNRGGIDPGPRIQDALTRRRGELQAELAQIGKAFPGVAGVMNVVRSLVLRINGTHLPVLRWAEDAYRDVIAKTALSDVLLGVATRRRASQVAWEQLLSQGITGFVDRSGRPWNLATYVEMATRTGVAQAAVEGHLDRLADAGLDLVMVSNAPQECERCRRWEGKILARTGPAGRREIQVQSAIGDGLVTVHIAGSVDEAIADGLFHPQCRHRLVVYLPGVTKIPRDTTDPEGDQARQHLRHLERKVRKEKLLAAAAIDPAAKRMHEAKARAWQGKIGDHVEATKDLGIKRKREREQINLGNGPHSTRIVDPPAPPKPKPTATQGKSETQTGSTLVDKMNDAAQQIDDYAQANPGFQPEAFRVVDKLLTPLFKQAGDDSLLVQQLTSLYTLTPPRAARWLRKYAAALDSRHNPRPVKSAGVRQAQAGDQAGTGPPIQALFPQNRQEAIDQPEQFHSIAADRLDGRYAGLEVKVQTVEALPHKVQIQATIFDEDGRAVGNTIRDFHNSTQGNPVMWVYHAYLQLSARVQGQGFAEAWNGHLDRWYRESGVAYVKVTANIDVGGYTWAAQGFDFADVVGPTLIARNLRRLVALDAFTEAQLDQVRAMLDRMDNGFGHPDFPTAHEVSQLGRLDGQGRADLWPGKQAMLGSTWSGIKWLK